ncbi:M4 family metallopeptidase [Runella sp. MFBS21]|uniref:M4 family metallopeptidase n=1 Tax=Runella sp. MFBS21 TaxID=3034018 RepID=UPI0023F81AE6|nr:M4 family metallopeptidase [Runella sp. MFBS21]MDF7817738.1 M4 family metallopeptidase [Runella sp. MFBS21]
MKLYFTVCLVSLQFCSWAQTNFTEQKPRKGTPQELPSSLKNTTQIDGQRALKKSARVASVSPRPLLAKVVRDSSGVAVFIEYRQAINTNTKGRAALSLAALGYVSQLKPLLQLQRPEEELDITTIEEDELKQTHIRLQQHHQGVPVYGGELILHLQNNQFTSINGQHFKSPILSKITPTLSLQDATQYALADLKQETIVRELSKGELSILKKQIAETELVVYHPETSPQVAHLAWHMVVRPNFIERWNYFVDAHTGEILSKTNHTCALDGPVKATARDLNGVNQTVNAYLKGTTYFLLDATKPMFNNSLSKIPDDPIGGIWTVDARNSKADDISLWQVTSSNNTWSPLAVSAHHNAGIAYNYFNQVHKRNSLDGKGGTVISVINMRDEDGKDMDNAFWNGGIMAYGNGSTAFSPLAGGLDVAAHEMTHGVIENTAKLEYQGQSGAINESIADIFGVLVDRTNWTIGESVVKKSSFPSGALRDLSNPNQSGINTNGYQPRNMSQYVNTTKDNGGVHINSGIPNHAFFLFANSANVGKDKAEKVYFRAMTTYLTRFSKFIDLRIAVIKATTDLFGANSSETTAARNAFDQVGITESNTQTPQKPTTLPTNTGQDFLLVYGSDQKLYSTSTTGGNITVKSTRPIINRPSVTDDGKYAYVVNNDRRIRAISLTGTAEESLISDETIWNKVAISKDGRKLAALTNQADKTIYVYSFDLKKWVRFKLYNPTYTSGVSTGDVQYADGLEWDASGEYLVYDAFNQLNTSNATSINYWDVGFIRVWDAVKQDFADGNIQKLFNNLDAGESIGNPAFAKNSTAILAFDYIYEPSNEYGILGVDLEKGNVNAIANNNTIGYPDYSRLDDRVVFTTKGSGTTQTVAVAGVEADKITGKTSPTTILNNATWPLWVSQGTRQLPTINFTAIADKFEYEGPFDLRATASNGDAVSFVVVSGPAQINGNKLTMTGAGTVTIKAYTNPERPFYPIATAERSFKVIPVLSAPITTTEALEVYPNPAVDEVRIKLPSKLQAHSLRLIDINGKVLLPQSYQVPFQETNLNLKHLNTGTYILSIETNEGVLQQKIVKQ